MDIKAYESTRSDILKIDDPNFKPENVCIVTGCGSGMGRAVAIAAAVNGLKVVGVDYNAVEAETTAMTARAMGGLMRVVWADLTKNADIEKVAAAAGTMGTVKYLANIARIDHINPIRRIPLEHYDAMQHLMLRAPYYLSLLVIPWMKRSPDGCGVIANMASIHIHDPIPNMLAYNIADFGLRGLSRSISAEGDGNIRSFTVGTGFARPAPPQVRADAPPQTGKTTAKEIVIDMMRDNRRTLMTPVEVANLVMSGFSRNDDHLAEGDFMPKADEPLPIADFAEFRERAVGAAAWY